MSIQDQNPFPSPDIQALNQLAAQADLSGAKVKKKLSGKAERFDEGEMPEWAAKHVEAYKQLAKAVNEMVARGDEARIPENVITSLKKSKEAVDQLANKVKYSEFIKAILPSPETVYPDSSGLLTALDPSIRPSHPNSREWELNFGLLYSTYQRTSNEDIKATIRFLMINYLAKAAFLNMSTEVPLTDAAMESYHKMLQLGQLTFGGVYHRTLDRTNPVLDYLGLTETVGSSKDKSVSLIPLETMEVQGLFNVGFITTPDISRGDEIVDILVQQFEAQLDRFPNDNLEFPILIDITAQIGQSIITGGDPLKIQEYEDKQKAVKEQLNEIINKAAAIIKEKYPDRVDIQDKVADYIKTNIAVVSRAKLSEHVAILGPHSSLFEDGDFENKGGVYYPAHTRNTFLIDKLKEWAGHSGTGIGAVNFRRAIADTCGNPEKLAELGAGRAVNYTVPGRTDVIIYEKPENLVRTRTFGMLSSIAQGVNPEIAPPIGKAQVMLARATVAMMNTLAAKISDEDWTDRQRDPAIREITQTAALRATQHLADAASNVHDFRKFSQAIDRTHAELTTLLTLYSPFDTRSFDENYTNFLQPIFPKPENPLDEPMRPAVVGIAKSAMNVFTGVNAAVLRNNPNPVRICGEHSYYEEVELVGGTRTLDNALRDPAVDKVDLYVAEFYHNIDVDPNHITYRKGTVIQDIRAIFREKPNTDRLTVAIDATIDFTQSEDMKALLQEFEQEIKDGKLNIVVFRSGQKFDMLGLDNYFGGPFYIVNNGDEKWAEFNRIKTDEVFHTDDVSLQYFNWMIESGPEIVDQYKKMVFDNTRAILDTVPLALKPAGGKEVCVCDFEEGVKTPFIDIKIDLADPGDQDDLRRWAQQRFMEIFTADGRLVYRRGSFGFAHANITWIEPKMRINPGLDPAENALYQQFFQELADKVAEIKNPDLRVEVDRVVQVERAVTSQMVRTEAPSLIGRVAYGTAYLLLGVATLATGFFAAQKMGYTT